VPREQWFLPDKSTLMEKRVREIDEGTNSNKGCGPVVRSNHNLEPKTAGEGKSEINETK
jgi:hypothetical protein